MNCRLVRLKSAHRNLRTDTITGTSEEIPTKGKRFVMTAEPLNPDFSVRVIETTEVTWIRNTPGGALFTGINSMVFQTENSTYRLDLL